QATTSVAVVSSANPAVFGQNVTFTATISIGDPGAGTPTGTVQFQIDGSDAGSPVSVTITGGVITASFSTASLTAGSYTITASYSGDSSFAGSRGTLASGQTVNQTAAAVQVVSSANASVFGQNVTFTATISAQDPGTPAGTVQFKIDGSDAGTPVSVTTLGGVTTASFGTSSLTVGSHAITASYSGGGNFSSGSGTLADGLTVKQAGTSTLVVSSADTAVFGQAVTFTATISITAPGAGTPSGTVQFQIDGSDAGAPVNVTISGGVITASLSRTLAVGSHAITASYSGDTSFAASSATAFTQIVNKASTAILVVSSVSPSVWSQSIKFTATVTGNASISPTGMVIFSDGGTSIAQGTLSTSGGITTASFSTANLAVGNHSITASYSGDTNFSANSVTALTQIVNKESTSMAVLSSANPSIAGQNVTFTATISMAAAGVGTPTGTVQFQIDGSNIGSPVGITTSDGVITATFSTASLTAGSHAIAASYGGDGNFSDSRGTLSGAQVVNPAKTIATTTNVASSVGTFVVGQSTTFTATIRASNAGTETPTGTVQFQIDSSDVGTPVSVTTSGGVTTASFTTSSLAAGSHTITASYSGGGSFLGSTGTLTSGVTVSQANSGTLLVASASPALMGQSVQISATVLSALWSPGPGGTVGVIPTGVVTFFDGTTVLGKATLNSTNGTTTVSINATNLSVGDHTIIAVYGGDHNYLPSKAAMTETVVSSLPPDGSGGTSNLASTTTSLLVSSQKLAFGQPIMLNAMVNTGPSGGGTLSGSLTFSVQGKPLASFPLAGSNGAFTILTLPPGQYTLSATYSGDSTHAGSTSSVTVTVGMSTAGNAAVGGVGNRPQVAQPSQQSPASTSAPVGQQVQGSNTGVAFVTAPPKNASNQAPDSSAVAGHTNPPSPGVTTRQLAAAIVAGTGNLLNPGNNAYKDFLKRPTDRSGVNSYLTALKGGSLDQANVAAAMLDSGELLGPIQ
ncbi:MAG TPA: Ig-like domain-containing protein, partial [Gemmataceae bacterium]|nr:Ig-like domain-containing protein [Gemmataceae bacterium]